MTRKMAAIRVMITCWMDSLMKVVVSTGKASLIPGGKLAESSMARFLTASAVCRAFAPGARRMAMPLAGRALTRLMTP